MDPTNNGLCPLSFFPTFSLIVRARSGYSYLSLLPRVILVPLLRPFPFRTQRRTSLPSSIFPGFPGDVPSNLWVGGSRSEGFAFSCEGELQLLLFPSPGSGVPFGCKAFLCCSVLPSLKLSPFRSPESSRFPPPLSLHVPSLAFCLS